MKTLIAFILVIVLPCTVIAILLDYTDASARSAFFMVYGPIGIAYVLYVLIKRIKNPS